MTQSDSAVELTETECNSSQMARLRESAFERAFEDGYFKSPRASTTMDSPRYMAKIVGSPMKYMWLSRVITTTGRLDEKGVYPSGLFKFNVTMDSSNSTIAKVDVEQEFI